MSTYKKKLLKKWNGETVNLAEPTYCESILDEACATVDALRDENDRLKGLVLRTDGDFQNAAMFIKRLCRKCYTLGHRSKLTDDAMDFINNTDAKCSPLRKMIEKIKSL